MSYKFVAALFATATALTAAVASAQVTYSAGEAAMVRGYVLTENKVQRYLSADQAIKAAKDTEAALRNEIENKDQTISLTALMALTKSKPATMAYYRKAGLSDADAVLIPVAIADATLSMAVPAAAKDFPASPAQIDYVKTHPAQMAAFSKSGE